jgi:hypothetical protein
LEALQLREFPGLSNCQRAILSHRLRRQQRARGSEPPSTLRADDLPKIDDKLPSPAEQADNLILWISDHQPSLTEYVDVAVPEVSAWIGAEITPKTSTGSAWAWLLDQEAVKRLVEWPGYSPNYYSVPASHLRLSMAGWQRYDALKHAQVESRTAFMAMQFGDAEFNRVVNDCLKPSVEAAGFELRLLTDGQPAGLIDDQLRVALRTARFVIADLTHGNNGAYWEEGLPKVWAARSSTLAANRSGTPTSRISIRAT